MSTIGFKYPWNTHGYWDYIKYPIKNFFWKIQAFKKIEVYPWDCCNVAETTLQQFMFFCNHNKDYFLKQAIRESNNRQFDNDEEYVEHASQKYKNLMRLHQLYLYCKYTRYDNQDKYDYIAETWHKSFTSKFIPWEKDPTMTEWVSDHEYYYAVDFWFEQNELIYTMTKVSEATNFNPLDIEYAIEDIDKAVAKEIIDLARYIWN